MTGRKNEARTTRVAEPGEVVPMDKQIFQPDPKRKGQTYKKWRKQLEALGYEIDTKELVAADYGAPTMRKRFFMIARCDGKPIVWPEPIHRLISHVLVRLYLIQQRKLRKSMEYVLFAHWHLRRWNGLQEG